MVSDDSIREKIAQVIQAQASKAVVFRWWVLGDDYSQWPGVLRAGSTDLDPATSKKRIHAYVIKRETSEGTRRDPYRVKRIYRYQILAFHYFFMGTEENNSEKLFTAELDAITAVLDDRAGLVDPSLQRADPINWQTKINTGQFGETLHIGIGSLSLEPC
ncbi:MAG TPA: hypothetical protein VJ302_30705 [Blastocatellia bacterium]|nr:hypothetical protein [Blastocatellia bacterium]